MSKLQPITLQDEPMLETASALYEVIDNAAARGDKPALADLAYVVGSIQGAFEAAHIKVSLVDLYEYATELAELDNPSDNQAVQALKDYWLKDFDDYFQYLTKALDDLHAAKANAAAQDTAGDLVARDNEIFSYFLYLCAATNRRYCQTDRQQVAERIAGFSQTAYGQSLPTKDSVWQTLQRAAILASLKQDISDSLWADFEKQINNLSVSR